MFGRQRTDLKSWVYFAV